MKSPLDDSITLGYEFMFTGMYKSFDIKLNNTNAPYLRNETDNYVEYIVGDMRYFCPKKTERHIKVSLIRCVTLDFERWLSNGGVVGDIGQYSQSMSNKSINDKEKIVSYDINHAYWRVAYLCGFISEKTYKNGLDSKYDKESYCIALACQGHDKIYSSYVGKKKRKGSVKVLGNPALRNMYDYIRNSTFRYMDSLRIKTDNKANLY